MSTIFDVAKYILEQKGSMLTCAQGSACVWELFVGSGKSEAWSDLGAPGSGKCAGTSRENGILKGSAISANITLPCYNIDVAR